MPAFLNRVEARGSLRKVNDPDVLVFPQQPPDQRGAMRVGPVSYHRHLSKAPLHLLEVPDEGGRVKPLVSPEELPAVLGDGAVHGLEEGALQMA